MKEIWLRTDETEQAFNSLKMVAEQLSNILGDSHRWIWAIISLHLSLQGFMVLALRGTDDLNVLKDADAIKWMKAYKDHAPTPTAKLDFFLNLYKKIKSEKMKIYSYSQVFLPGNSHDFSVARLNEFRNEFIHFVPAQLSLEITGLPKIVSDCLDIIRFLALDCGNITWDYRSLERDTIKLIELISLHIGEIENKYRN